MSFTDLSSDQAVSKAGRWFDLKTPLGDDVLIVTEVVGEEGMSRLFTTEITVVSVRQSIDPGDILGKEVMLGLGCLSGVAPKRYLCGIVTRLRAGRYLRSGLREYRLFVAPSLWRWQRTSRYKVYQTMSAKDIVLKLLGDDSVVKFKNNLRGTYDAREYCVQYGETDFDFFMRLTAEEGIFYYFTHAADGHTLVLEDGSTWSAASSTDLAYNSGDRESYDVVNSFEAGPGLIDSKFTITDYDFESPSTQLKGTSKTSKAPSASQGWDQRGHALRLPTQSSAQAVSSTEIGSAEAEYETAAGQGSDPRLAPGFIFALPDLGAAAYVVVGVRYDGVEPAWGVQSRDEKRPPYRNSFDCVPVKTALPRRVPPQKPLARGPTTGLVVGPSGAEIHTDKYGRVRVQFFWDLDGTNDEKSSCFIRVAQPWAGAKWGSVFVPRVGMEVVVQFLDGDPDRPLVIGTVYNGANMPPWALPDKMNKSGILTRSTKNGAVANANELSFDDTKGSEVLLIHAEKDHQREIENDETVTVGHDQISKIENDRTVTVKQGKDTLTVETGDRTATIKQGNDAVEVTTGNRSIAVKTGNHDLKVSLGNASTKCDAGTIALQAAQSVKLTCGMNTLELTPQGIKINGIQVTVQGTAMVESKAPMITVKADALAQIEGGIVQIN